MQACTVLSVLAIVLLASQALAQSASDPVSLIPTGTPPSGVQLRQAMAAAEFLATVASDRCDRPKLRNRGFWVSEEEGEGGEGAGDGMGRAGLGQRTERRRVARQICGWVVRKEKSAAGVWSSWAVKGGAGRARPRWTGRAMRARGRLGEAGGLQRRWCPSVAMRVSGRGRL